MRVEHEERSSDGASEHEAGDDAVVFDAEVVAGDADAADAADTERRKSSVRENLLGTLRMAWEASSTGLLIAAGMALFGALLQPALVLAGKALVDGVAAGKTAGMLVVPLVVLGTLTAVQRIFTTVQNTRQELYSRSVALHAERQFLGRAAAVDLGHFDSSDWHDRMSRARWDLNWRPYQMVQTLIGLGGSAVVLIAMTGVLLSLHPVLVGLVVLSASPVVFIQRRANRHIYSFHFDWTPARREEEYLATMLAMSQNAKELRAFNLEGHFLERHNRLAVDRYGRMQYIYRYAEKLAVLTGLLGGLALSSAYAFVALRGASGELTPGDLTALIGAIASVTQQVGSMSSALLVMDQHSQFLSDYFDFLKIEELVERPEHPVSLGEKPIEEIVFDDVHFTYPGGTEPALSGFSLTIRRGELIALVGENGAGKTSVVKLLERFYDPDAGAIRLNGIDVRRLDPVEQRDRIGVLFQDYVNYELTARDSVVFGRVQSGADDQRVKRALAAARATDVVMRLPKGLDSNVGRLFEGGHDLSGGQWQRLALARLMYRSADVWILDEPTSALDPEAEAAIFAELRENLQGRIGIVISHRFSTVRIADRIAVVEGGRVAELGTHSELLARGGRYAELFELQALGYR